VGQIRVADWVSFPLPMTAPIDDLARDGIPYVPYFPLGGFNPLQSSILSKVATRLDATPMQVALAWLLRSAHNILLIPGTSSVAHLRENLTSIELNLPDDAVTTLNGIGSTAPEVNATLPRVG
jgi:pyridoxine 4-dehydrogenase